MSEFSKVNVLLGSSTHWNDTASIVQQTFRELVNVITKQSEAISELDRKLNTRPTRTELNQGLSVKANTQDVEASIKEHANPTKLIR
jgi:hypothetical protein